MRKLTRSGQHIFEYTLLTVAVVLVLFVSLNPNGLVTKTISKTVEFATEMVECMPYSVCFSANGCPPSDNGCCEKGESSSSTDCGGNGLGPEVCGNGICEYGGIRLQNWIGGPQPYDEICSTCPQDCGQCPPSGLDVDGEWCAWSNWNPCNGTPGTHTRYRACSCPAPSGVGAACVGQTSESETCNAADDGGWCGWSNWTNCVAGLQSHHRSCACPAPSAGGAMCSGPSVQNQHCVVGAPVCSWGPWGPWGACQGSPLQTTHTRICVCPAGFSPDCVGSNSETSPIPCAPVDGQWCPSWHDPAWVSTDPNGWSICRINPFTGLAEQTRQRDCNCPAPLFGGANCLGSPTQTQSCIMCGDGICNGTETPTTCPNDCFSPPTCGDGICSSPEDSVTCPADCLAGGHRYELVGFVGQVGCVASYSFCTTANPLAPAASCAVCQEGTTCEVALEFRPGLCNIDRFVCKADDICSPNDNGGGGVGHRYMLDSTTFGEVSCSMPSSGCSTTDPYRPAESCATCSAGTTCQVRIPDPGGIASLCMLQTFMCKEDPGCTTNSGNGTGYRYESEGSVGQVACINPSSTCSTSNPFSPAASCTTCSAGSSCEVTTLDVGSRGGLCNVERFGCKEDPSCSSGGGPTGPNRYESTGILSGEVFCTTSSSTCSDAPSPLQPAANCSSCTEGSTCQTRTPNRGVCDLETFVCKADVTCAANNGADYKYKPGPSLRTPNSCHPSSDCPTVNPYEPAASCLNCQPGSTCSVKVPIGANECEVTSYQCTQDPACRIVYEDNGCYDQNGQYICS